MENDPPIFMSNPNMFPTYEHMVECYEAMKIACLILHKEAEMSGVDIKRMGPVRSVAVNGNVVLLNLNPRSNYAERG